MMPSINCIIIIIIIVVKKQFQNLTNLFLTWRIFAFKIKDILMFQELRAFIHKNIFIHLK